MDENEYRSTYHALNETRCVFEKSILTQSCHCPYQEKFNLAEREGVRCCEPSAQNLCHAFLSEIRNQARFALGLTEIVGNLLPHNKEIQVQKGALLGLTPDLPNLPDTAIDNIHALIADAVDQNGGSISDLPFNRLIPAIKHHPQRARRRRRSRNDP